MASKAEDVKASPASGRATSGCATSESSDGGSESARFASTAANSSPKSDSTWVISSIEKRRYRSPIGNEGESNNKEGRETMRLEEATTIAEKVKETLSPYCEKIEIVGSIRRGKPVVHDIDMVLIERPSAWLLLNSQIASIGRITLGGDKIKSLWYGDKKSGIAIDIYFATPATWATLLLIRTGSKESNIRLASIAKRQGWHLKASGDGLFNGRGKRIAGETEESIYRALGIPYQEPQERG